MRNRRHPDSRASRFLPEGPEETHDDLPDDAQPEFDLPRLIVWCGITLASAAGVVWTAWYTSAASMGWPLRIAIWLSVLVVLRGVTVAARRVLEATGHASIDAPPSEHALRGAALIAGVVITTAYIGSSAGREAVLQAAEAVPVVVATSATVAPDTSAAPPTTAARATTTTTGSTSTSAPPAATTTTLDLPSALPDRVTARPGERVRVDVLANDDPALDPSTVTVVIAPPGTATVGADGAITITLDASVSSDQTLSYRACTTDDLCVGSVVSITLG